ncbi:MAG: LuxR C-terminal-related transcriptional regulator [Tannerella sp.]|jgi:DNA-binding CsgD family transcriptional regulator|nr:LuxR C-terminal-related transcriptional regulator [Tannerella sp.]
MDAVEKQKIWESHKKHIELLAKVNNSYVYVGEYLEKKYLYMSGNLQQFFDADLDGLFKSQTEGEDFLAARIHPEDHQVLAAIQTQLIEFIFSQPIEKRKNFKYICEFRGKTAEGEYVRIINQKQILELDENGNPWLIMGIADLSLNTAPLDNIKIQVVNYVTGETFPLTKFEEKGLVEITRREKEILLLIKSGMLSKEISDRLSVSIHTVNKHRQNIMQKMNADNIIEAMEYARKLGFLDE